MDDDYFIDFNSDIEINDKGMLPHWHQKGKIQFVTFRLADSLPQERILELKTATERFNARHPRPWSKEVFRDYERIITRREENLLDNGYGSCILSDAQARRYVTEAIEHLNGKKCDFIAYVIMPNHVHLLLRLAGDSALSSVVQTIKRYSSTMINRLTRSAGQPLWQRDYHDRLIRNHDHLKYCLHYIKANPIHLPPDKYELWFAK